MMPLILAFVLLWAAPADADIVRLKNGNVLEGELISQNEQQVVIEMPDVGRMTFDRAEVAVIEQRARPKPVKSAQPSASAPVDDMEAVEDAFEEEAEPEPCTVEARKIQSLYVTATARYGQIVGRAMFHDGDGTACRTTGSLAIKRRVTEYETKTVFDTPTTSREVQVPVNKEETVKSVSFRPASFTTEGPQHTYFEFRMSPGDVRIGESLIAEWRSFRVDFSVTQSREGSY